MPQFVLTAIDHRVGIITLNRPEKLNAWNSPMRQEIVDALEKFSADPSVAALIMTGTGEHAFCAGQDLEEAHGFDVARSELWMREWELYYSTLRGLSKPLVMALNGIAAGSGFQVALLGDVRVAHPGVAMGQPEINSGIASVTGPWIMNLMLGLSRTVELTLTGRLMDADECHRIGLVHHLVSADQVLPKAMEVARELAAKPPIAMRLDKQRFREMTQASFDDAITAGIRIQALSYATDEPARMMEEFFKRHGGKITPATRP